MVFGLQLSGAFMAGCLFASQVAAQDLVKGDDGTGVHILYQTNAWLAPNLHYKIDGQEWTTEPGVPMEASEMMGFSNSDGWFQYDVPSASNLEFAFTNGMGAWENNNQKNYNVKAGTWSVVSSVFGPDSQSLVKRDDGTGITVLYRITHWNKPRIHYNNGNGWTEFPGVEMKPSTQVGKFSAENNWFQHTIDGTSAEVAFNDGDGNWDSNLDKNYRISSAGTYAYIGQNEKRYDGYVDGSGYQVTNVVESGDRTTLSLSLNPSSTETPFGADLKELLVEVSQSVADTIHVKITDKNNHRWEVPKHLFTHGTLSGNVARSTSGERLYDFSYTKNPFSFKVTRKSDNYVLFDSSALSMVLKDQYLQIGTKVESDLSIYGLGESTRSNMRVQKGAKHTLWARDQAAMTSDVNLYGAHPYYFAINGEGNSHAVLLVNSNGMDVTLEDDKLVYQTIGGVFDFYIMAGSTPSKVMDQYTSLIGRPKLMPYWSYGYHQCRWNYPNAQTLREVVDKYAEEKIPLDVIWADIDYMNNFYPFTVDSKNFPESEMKDLINYIHKKEQKMVPILDPGIPDDASAESYRVGSEMDVFVKDTRGKYYLGQVWPGPTVFPDFLHPNSTDYWKQQLQHQFDLFQYDGLWIDMNELANFCPGIVCERDPTRQCPNPGGVKDITKCCLRCMNDGNKFDNPPYAINNVNMRDPIYVKAISTSSLHYGGVRDYDAHNLFGLTESIATDVAQEKMHGRRSFVLSRSTFPGSGAHAAHWTGDNAARWEDLGWSIPSILNFGLYGIPMVGADICGFHGNSNMELCARWTALGSFYPFARNHNEYFGAPQETYVWSEVAEVGRKFIGLRYRLLPYFYTLGYEAHMNGMPVARALFLEFPSDSNTREIDRQFMVGSGLVVTPVLASNAQNVWGYLPAGVWYNIFDYKREESKGQWYDWSVSLYDMPVHVRGGSIIPMQQSALTSAEVRATPFELLVALSAEGDASGELFLDDGEEVSAKDSTIVKFAASKGSFSSKVEQNKYSGADSSFVGKVVVLGVVNKPSAVSMGSFEYDEATQRLTIDVSDEKQTISSDFKISWE